MTEHPMTNQHPLTNEKALSLFSFERLLDTSQPLEIEDCMRTAADWQLAQVIKFLRNDEYLEAIAQQINVEEIIDDLKKAMRPTTQEDN